VFLKLENLQITGSFKYRGALNWLSALAEHGQQKNAAGFLEHIR
jgi:threonine dehydratase